MSILSEGASISHPPLLDGTNYPYWKTRIKSFIRALDIRALRSILIGWKPFILTDSEGMKVIKPEVDWSNDDDCLANYNNMALHVTFNGFDTEHIKLISSCETTKEAWEIFQITFEGLGDVKRNKLLSLTTHFENLRMHDDESLFDFYTKLCDIANESFALGEKIPETILVRKIVRSLHDRFSSKVIAIKEAKDLDSMKVKDLMGSLRAFEMILKQRKREKFIALKTMHEEEDSNEEDNEYELALQIKNLKKFLKKVGKSSKSSLSFPNTFKGKNSSKNSYFSNNKKRIQGRECERSSSRQQNII